jgi:drug/metabolite transporter (DMT)-like permease
MAGGSVSLFHISVDNRIVCVMPPHVLATLIGFGAIVLWSSLALMTAASGSMPPFELAALTFLIGGLLGVPALFRSRKGWALFRQPLPVWTLGIGGLFLYHAFYFAALRLAPPAEAGLISYLWPLLIVLMSALLPGERLRSGHIIGAIAGFGGVALLLGSKQGGFGFDQRYWPGYALAFCCAFIWSGYSILSRRYRDAPTEMVAVYCLATSALALAAHTLFETTVWPENMMQWLAIVGLGLGPVGAAFYVWDWGVKRGDIKILGVTSYAAPVLSTFLLVVTGYAEASLSLGLATLLIVSGALLATRSND